MTALLDPELDITNVTGTWGVLRVATSREVAVAERLTECGFNSFCPAVKVRRIYRTKKVIADVAVYPNYIFAAWTNELERHDIRRTRDVHEVIHVPAWEYERFLMNINSLAKTIEHDPFLDVADWAVPGVRVRVTEGTLKNVEGEIIQRRGRSVLVVGVTMFGRSGVELDIDPLCVERI